LDNIIDFAKLREELESVAHPMYFFHDDADGVASFLILYKFVKEGVGVPVKTQPVIDLKFAPKVRDYEPDKLFILDIANVNQDFLDEVRMPVIWVDHHEPQDRTKVKIFNPRVKHPKMYIPATYLCWKAVKDFDWIMIVGCLGDAYLPPEAKQFAKDHPELITEKEASDVGLARYESKIGKLINVFSFIIKGKVEDAKKCVKVLTKINSPEEILNQTTPEGKFIWTYYEKVNAKYLELWSHVSHMKPRDKAIVFTYTLSTYSFTGNLADDLQYKHPHTLIVIGRDASDEVRGSLRYDKGGLPKMVQEALKGIYGYGGGHDQACGFTVKKDDFNQFVENLKSQL